jgi:hypothetical protein
MDDIVEEHDILGYMKGSITIIGDIVAPIDEIWDADT